MPKAATKKPMDAPAPLAPTLNAAEATAMAKKAKLVKINQRPPLTTYVRQIWNRRAFIAVHATSIAYARNRESYLGQLWSVLTPTLNAAIYVIIFGVMLGTQRGLENVIAFIVVGTFMYRFFNRSVSVGGRSLPGNANLVRSLRFPRAILPISTCFTEFVMFIPTTLVMAVFCVIAGYWPGYGPVPIRWSWLLIIPVVLIFWVFNTGCGLLMARIEANNPDISNVIPNILRLVMYMSGVIFSISHFVSNPALQAVLMHQPVAVYLYLARMVLLNEPSIPFDPQMWLWGVGWAVLFFVAGFLIFWKAEEEYGRV